MPPQRVGFYSRKQIAEIFGFTIVYFDRDVRPHLQPADVQREPLLFRAAGVHQFLVERAVRKATVLPDEDGMLAGPDSVWLEAFRKERTLSERLKRKLAERRLVAVDDVRQKFQQWAGLIRKAADKLQKKFGPGAHDLFDRALAEAEADHDAYLAEMESDRVGDDDADSPSSDD